MGSGVTWSGHGCYCGGLGNGASYCRFFASIVRFLSHEVRPKSTTLNHISLGSVLSSPSLKRFINFFEKSPFVLNFSFACSCETVSSAHLAQTNHFKNLRTDKMPRAIRPMKKKGGGPLAGIPRQSGERSPTAGNSASNNMVSNPFSCAFLSHPCPLLSLLSMLCQPLCPTCPRPCLEQTACLQPYQATCDSLVHFILEYTSMSLTYRRTTTMTTAAPVEVLAIWFAVMAVPDPSISSASTPQ